MEYLNTIEPITMEQFLPMVIQFKMDGWRLVQICACRLPEQYELSYSFAKGFDMRTLRITQVYPCAFIQENEVAELFGVKIESMENDYHHKLYRIARDTPFKEKG